MIKKIFYLLIPILTFFGIQTVYAATMSPYWFDYRERISSGTLNWTHKISSKNDVWNNLGRGYIIGSFFVERTYNNAIDITGINISAETFYACEVIDTKTVVTNGIYQENYSLKCPVVLGSQGWREIAISFDSSYSGTTNVGFRSIWSFVSEEYTNEQLSTIISILQNSSGINDVTSKLDEVNKSITDSNKKIDEVNFSINNSDTSDSQSELEKVNDKFKDDVSKSPISDLITLPLKLLTAFNNKLSANQVCIPYDMGTIFGIHWLQLPCINPPDYLGSVLWATIDMISTALLLWAIAHKMVKVYISITSIDGQFVTKIISQTGGML